LYFVTRKLSLCVFSCAAIGVLYNVPVAKSFPAAGADTNEFLNMADDADQLNDPCLFDSRGTVEPHGVRDRWTSWNMCAFVWESAS
jgi:hypothetical protein